MHVGVEPRADPSRNATHDSLAMSIEGCFLISGSRDCTAKVWDCVSGQCLKSFTSHTGPVTYVSSMFRPPQMLDGSHLKCSTPLNFLARRQETATPEAPGFAGPNRRFPILTQGISVAGVAGAESRGIDHEGLAAHAAFEWGSEGAGDEGGAAKAENAQAEAERWRSLAGAMHQFVVDSLLVPAPQE